ncbi:MAG: substrate-binding domain-containing protein [Caulobacterales bacterium]|nr:substrate-binding domain-containing protein [Caulobacterales bacterium]
MIRRAYLAAALGALIASAPAQARDWIRVVGSSTVFPFSTAVAEQFAYRTDFKSPIVEPTGTGGGLKLFCDGVGAEHPDVSTASRPIKVSEFDLCRNNGVNAIVEVELGYDGIVLANTKEAPDFNISAKHLFAAVAAEVPLADDDCTLVPNPHTRWSDIDPTLPPLRIEVFGPPPTSGTRDAFVELGMEGGALQYPCLAELEERDGDAFQAVAHKVREDGLWIDSGENDNSIVQTLRKTPTALGVFGFSFLDQNADSLKGAIIDGAEPTYENIASGDYPISRSMYVYVKKQHVGVIPGVQDFARELVSDEAFGPFGYLADKGLIALGDDGRDRQRTAVEDLIPMTRGALTGPTH